VLAGPPRGPAGQPGPTPCTSTHWRTGMSGKSLLYTALVSLTVVVAYEKYSAAGRPGIKVGS